MDSLNMNRCGFTLMELLISMTIIGVLMVIVMSAFHTGIRAWEKGERDLEENLRQQVVLKLVKQQLASARLVLIEQKDNDPFYFKGDEETLNFVSGISIVPANRYGQVVVQYRILNDKDSDGMILEIREKSLALIPIDKDFNDFSGSNWHKLVWGMDKIEFQYLLKDEERQVHQWQTIWDPENLEADYPAAVRFMLKAKKSGPEAAVIARLQDEHVN